MDGGVYVYVSNDLPGSSKQYQQSTRRIPAIPTGVGCLGRGIGSRIVPGFGYPDRDTDDYLLTKRMRTVVYISFKLNDAETPDCILKRSGTSVVPCTFSWISLRIFSNHEAIFLVGLPSALKVEIISKRSV